MIRLNILDPDPLVTIEQRCGSGFFYNHAKTVRKTLIPAIL
jgi:hypothetical protein